MNSASAHSCIVQAKRGCHRRQQGIHLGQTRQIKKGNQLIIRTQPLLWFRNRTDFGQLDPDPDPQGCKSDQQEKKKFFYNFLFFGHQIQFRIRVRIDLKRRTRIRIETNVCRSTTLQRITTFSIA